MFAEAFDAVVKDDVRRGLIQGIFLLHCNTQEIIIQYADNTPFTMKANNYSLDNLVGIMHKFGLAFGLMINWTKSVAYWCDRGIPPRWVRKHQWKWALPSDLFKLLGTPFGLQLDLKNIDQLMLGQVKNELNAFVACW